MRLNMHKIRQLRRHHLDSEEKFLYHKERAYFDQPVGDAAICQPRNGITYILLAWLFGIFGAHNFYSGHYWRGTIQLVLTLGSWLLMFIPLLFAAIWSYLELLLENRSAGGGRFSGNHTVIYGLRFMALLWVAFLIYYVEHYVLK